MASFTDLVTFQFALPIHFLTDHFTISFNFPHTSEENQTMPVYVFDSPKGNYHNLWP